jgi:hypothetical protein
MSYLVFDVLLFGTLLSHELLVEKTPTTAEMLIHSELYFDWLFKIIRNVAVARVVGGKNTNNGGNT